MRALTLGSICFHVQRSNKAIVWYPFFSECEPQTKCYFIFLIMRQEANAYICQLHDILCIAWRAIVLNKGGLRRDFGH